MLYRVCGFLLVCLLVWVIWFALYSGYLLSFYIGFLVCLLACDGAFVWVFCHLCVDWFGPVLVFVLLLWLFVCLWVLFGLAMIGCFYWC